MLTAAKCRCNLTSLCCFTFCNYTPKDHLFDPSIAIASTISNSFSKAASKFNCKRTPGDSPDPACSLYNEIMCLDFTCMETGMWEMAGGFLDSLLMESLDEAGVSTCIWEFRNTPGLQIPDIIKEVTSWCCLLHCLVLSIFPEQQGLEFVICIIYFYAVLALINRDSLVQFR